jgi:hypothetical protein
MYRVGIVGHHPDNLSDRDAVERKVDQVIDLISYQYKDLVINAVGDIGVGLWAAEACLRRDIRFHIFLYDLPEIMSEGWYGHQQRSLSLCCNSAWATSIYSTNLDRNLEIEAYKTMTDMSDFLICFWNGKKQGLTFSCIKYSLESSKITLNGLKDLQLITNEDTSR